MFLSPAPIAGRAVDGAPESALSDVAEAVAVSKTPRLFHVLLIFAMPWLQLAVNRNLFITPAGNFYIDPWVYTGFFLSMPDLMARFPDTYYGARVSWLLPGYLAHKAFSPLLANYVLHFALFYLLLAATYFLLSATANRRAAMLITITLAWNPVVLAAVSWDYVDGVGIVFIMGTLLSLEKATQAHRARWAWSLLAGTLMASMVCSNLFLVVVWPLFGLYLVLRAGTDRFRDIGVIGLTAIAGATFAFLALAAMNVALGGSWLILMPQIRISQQLVSAPNRWLVAGYAWVLHARALVLPVAATIGAAVGCLKSPRNESGFARAMQITMLAAVAVWTAVHLSGTPVFQISYYTSYLAPFALIVLSLHFAAPSSRLRPHVVLILECAAVVLFAGAHYIAGQWLDSTDTALFWSPINLAGGISLAALSTLVVLVVAVRWVSVEWARWVMFAVCFSILVGAAPPYLPLKSQPFTQPYYEGVVTAHRFIGQHLDKRRLRIWTSDPLGGYRPINGIASTYLWGFTILNQDLPRLDKKEAALLTRSTRLVLLVPRVEDAEAVRAPLEEFGFGFNVIASQTFGLGVMAVAVVIGELTPLPDVVSK